ncbi:piggyBac transposable element-derived protein 4-like isoform X1 [Maniola jurtina]|uniref:piggyBac transposable element-derived protein 4-like isoform X1 n=1 Tax=Maniola jurtina TaxID=191418 RepID=UPI001E68D7A7|nr:piggyBac transposable element-derived protein 4-like isoform X1 [Maniola jurtina]XP_045772815.1 piggyBac transposable element-derived protein 4-like isoform X1 [Maniola jurtina]
MAFRDSYEKEQKRLQDLFDAVSSPESCEDPFADDGGFGSDVDYEPSGEGCSSSEDEAQASQIRQVRRNRARVSSGDSNSTSSSDTDDSEERNQRDIVTSDIRVSHEHTQLLPSDVHVNESTNLPNPDTATYSQRSSDITEPLTEESWSSTIADIPDFNFDSSQCGITVNIDGISQVLDFFHLVFPSSYIEYLVNCTNNYGKTLCNSNRPHTRHSRKITYREVTPEEMLKFLGLTLLKGLIKCPKQRHVFSLSDPLYYHPIFSFVMSGRRYEQILRCIYVSELDAKGENKIVKFIDMMTLNFRQVYNADKELSLDESLLLFRGRLHFRQYIKSKKARYGIKFYELTTHDGYVLNIKMYSGKEAIEENTSETESKTEKLVLRLMRPYLLRGHHIFMDNFYNSVNLSRKLLDLKTHSTGTLRTNRKGNPAYIVKKKLKKGEHVWARKDKIYVSNWKDKRPVVMITTAQHPLIVEVRNRFGKTRPKPAEVELYNRNMSGIDRSDQMISYYSCPRKTIRWYKKVFFHILDIAVWNAYFLFKKYRKNNAPTYNYINYREELIKVMIGISGRNIKPKDMISQRSIHDNRRFRPSTSTLSTPSANIPVAENVTTGHWPEQMLSRPGTSKKFAFLKCKVCSKNNIRKETSYRCKGCPDKPPLCPSCFEAYHGHN